MARTDNLNNFLTDVADSIRTKKGTADVIPASNFDTEIASIETSEDLSNELNTYDSELTEQNNKLINITNALVNKGTIGGSLQMNVFLQSKEPDAKNGIWIKQDNLTMNELLIIPYDVSKPELVYKDKATTPRQFREPGACVIGDNIYFFGGINNVSSTNYYPYGFKYNTLTNTYTQLSNMPYSAYGIGCEAYGTDIYLFGGRSNTYYNYTYKYDTLTDTYTRLIDIPISVGQMGTTIIDDNIYLFGGSISGTQTTNVYKYNITNNSYTQLTSYPIKINTPGTVNIGDNVYLFGGYSSPQTNKCYKYNITSNSYESIELLPYSAYGTGAVVCDNLIYIFGGGGDSGSNHVHIYDPQKNTYTSLDSMPFLAGRVCMVIIKNKAYMIGGIIGSNSYSNTMKEITIKNISLDNITNNSVLIECVENNYKTMLSDNNKILFSNAYYYSTKKEEYETYYGNGTNWEKIS